MAEYGFDTNAGELLVGQEAIGRRAAQAGSAVTSLTVLLSGDVFPFAAGDFPLADTRSWQPDDYLSFGKWALGVVADEGVPRPLTRP
jgi:hypothetical protein